MIPATHAERGRYRSASRSAALSRSNDLLDDVPPRDRAQLARLLEPVVLASGEVLHEPGQIRQVYFPLDCVVSLLAPLKGRQAIECAVVGSEGMVGVPLVLGIHTSPLHAIIQGSGSALRIGAPSFSRELQRNTPLKNGLDRYIHLRMGQLTQTAACNTFHSIEARCARWLLMSRDRMGSDKIEVTHEFLARMLGVRRVGVTVAAGNLQRQGLISYTRGHMTILNGGRLAKSACECYGVVRKLYRSRH
jgi:CRP-like cAMP-binding protein